MIAMSADYAPALKTGGCFVSIAAGCLRCHHRRVVGDAAIVRVIPNSRMVGLELFQGCLQTGVFKHSWPDVTALIANRRRVFSSERTKSIG
jgi:pyrroline-5-carboxylate reductase